MVAHTRHMLLASGLENDIKTEYMLTHSRHVLNFYHIPVNYLLSIGFREAGEDAL